MKNITEVVDSIINELDGRKGFEFGDLDEDILDEIKDELAKLILPVVVNRRELLLDFADYSERDKTSETTDECVDNYLDSIK